MRKQNIFFNTLIILGLAVCSVVSSFAYEDANEKNIKQAQIAYKKGVELVRSRAYDSAIEAFQTAIKYNPKMTDAYYNIASIYVYQKKYNEAYNMYVKLLAINPKDYDSILQAAKISYNRKDYALAMKYLKYIPDDYEKYGIVRQLMRDSKEMFDAQKNRIERAKITTASKSKLILTDNLNSPAGIVVDSEGNMYVACYSENSVIKIDSSDNRTNYVKDYLLEGPVGLAIDNYDNIYVANFDGNNILKITKGGNVSVFMENISNPYFLYIKDDVLYISEQGNNVVVKYNLAAR